MAKCVITGCWLVDADQCKRVWGDMHKQGACYVFNACLDNDGDAAWDYSVGHDGLIPDEDKSFIIPSGENYFERRGVIVSHAVPTQLAKDYMEKYA